MKQKYLFLFLVGLTAVGSYAQKVLTGKVLEKDTKEPIPFVTVILKKSAVGTIANEEGEFKVVYRETQTQDSISFQAVGYKTKTLALKDISKDFLNIDLVKDITEINPVVLTGKNLSAEKIVEKILENRGKNYLYHKIKVNNAFYRSYASEDVEELDMDFKKGTIPWLSKSKLEEIERTAPKHSTEQFGVLGDLYLSQREKKGTDVKLVPKKVSLYETEKIDEVGIFKTFNEEYANLEKKEYWRVKSGIIKKKIEMDTDSLGNISPNNIKRLRRSLFSGAAWLNFNNKKGWEFLHKTNRYNYHIDGITKLNNEEVYIIDFTPKKKGVFKGKMYVSVESYALVKANYEHAEGKSSGKFKALGFSIERKDYKGNIFFTKVGKKYQLKFFSNSSHDFFGVDRKVTLQKRRERFLLDKTLEEIKIDFKLKTSVKSSFDYLIIDAHKIKKEEFDKIKEPKTFNPVKTKELNTVFQDLLHESALKEIEMYKHWDRE
ncbi:carboxypeptidase-like regulatory domain-containing protein [Wenyingzhuangia sp. IMCC45574]